MCTGRTHAMQGAIVGLAVPACFQTLFGYTPPLPAVLLGAVLCTGGALIPDLDTLSSTATSSFGPATDLVSKMLRWLSRLVFRLTATRTDRARTKGTHRGLTHTLVFAIALGAATAWLAGYGFPAVLAIMFVVSFLALRGLPPVEKNLTDVLTAAAITGLTWLTVDVTALPGWWVGAAIGTGALTHTLGDAITDKGVPLLAPIPLGNRTWRPLGTPRLLRISTGHWVELKLLLWLNSATLAVLLINLTPGGHEDLVAILGHTTTA